MNRYSYCRNNPINYIDPTGHKWSWGNFFHSLLSGIVGGATFFLTGGNFILAGMAAGAVSGALSGGGLQAVLMGAATGAALGGVAGIGPAFAIGTLIAGVAYTAATQGWEGLGYMAGSMIGGAIGYAGAKGTAQALSNSKTGSNLANQKVSTGTSKENKAAANLKTDQTPRAVKVYGQGESGRPELKGAMYDGKFYPAKSAQGGEKIFRVYGGNSLQKGDSWTPVDPFNTPNFSDIMGLPEGNTQGALIGGRLVPGARYVELSASPIGNNSGGGVEYLLDNPNKDITTELITTWDFTHQH